MFEVNNLKITKVSEKHSLYEIENFYKDPNEIYNFLNSFGPQVHKFGEEGSKNTIDFLDLRHTFFHEDFLKTEKIIYNTLNRDSKNCKGLVGTNLFKILKKTDLENKYWSPHTDSGIWTFIIYFNKNGCDGTNIYKLKSGEHDNSFIEHLDPWKDKTNYELIYNFKSSYNKAVIFPCHYLHGMAISSEKFYNEFRINQVFFIQ